jgi:hypothetical protein
MHIHVSKKSMIISVVGGIIGALFLWLYLQNILLFFSLHSPFPRHFIAVHLTSGEVFYGHLGGGSGGMMKLADAYFVETYKPATGGSNDFSLGDPSSPDSAKFVLTKRANPLYINHAEILYWENVDPASDVGRYLR